MLLTRNSENSNILGVLASSRIVEGLAEMTLLIKQKGRTASQNWPTHQARFAELADSLCPSEL